MKNPLLYGGLTALALLVGFSSAGSAEALSYYGGDYYGSQGHCYYYGSDGACYNYSHYDYGRRSYDSYDQYYRYDDRYYDSYRPVVRYAPRYSGHPYDVRTRRRSYVNTYRTTPYYQYDNYYNW